MKFFKSIVLSLLVAQTVGWSCLPPSPVKKIKAISRKSFLVGAATGLVVGTTATAAGAAVAIDANNRSNKDPYQPAAGSLADKVVLITGGTAGLGLVSFCNQELVRTVWSKVSKEFLTLSFLQTISNLGIGKAIGNSRSHHCSHFPNCWQGRNGCRSRQVVFVGQGSRKLENFQFGFGFG